MNCGVYMITCIPTGKKYIGSSIDISKRLRDHVHRLDGKKAKNNHLRAAWKKYGRSKFLFEVLENCLDRETALEREAFWIAMLATNDPARGFNRRLVVDSCLGIRHGEAVRKIFSKAQQKRMKSLTPIERFINSDVWRERGKNNSGRKFEPYFAAMKARHRCQFSPSQISDICNQYYEGAFQYNIAKMHGTDQGTISMIVNRKYHPSLYEPGMYERSIR